MADLEVVFRETADEGANERRLRTVLWAFRKNDLQLLREKGSSESRGRCIGDQGLWRVRQDYLLSQYQKYHAPHILIV